MVIQTAPALSRTPECCSLSRGQQRQRDLNRGSAGNCAERSGSHARRQLDRAYARNRRRPLGKVADMPHMIKFLARRQEAVRKLE